LIAPHSIRDFTMQTVFLVHHVHELGDGREDVKLIGVFSTEERALAALERLKLQPGFRESVPGFHVERWTVDQVTWTEGFVTIDPDEERS
jgi:hypothetical protein